MASTPSTLTRRKFITGTVVLVLGSGLWTFGPDGSPVRADTLPPSDGYLLVDVERCQGCVSCMLACSLVHHGEINPSLSRIQIMQNSFLKFPEDLAMAACRQCREPACAEACPENAITAPAAAGHVRQVDTERCTGCGSCADACPYSPSRILVAPGDSGRALKCDLCADAPWHWDKQGGGPDGFQACVSVCPMGAVRFSRKPPAGGDA